jgi:hypothetical protein
MIWERGSLVRVHPLVEQASHEIAFSHDPERLTVGVNDDSSPVIALAHHGNGLGDQYIGAERQYGGFASKLRSILDLHDILFLAMMGSTERGGQNRHLQLLAIAKLQKARVRTPAPTVRADRSGYQMAQSPYVPLRGSVGRTVFGGARFAPLRSTHLTTCDLRPASWRQRSLRFLQCLPFQRN